jgi:CRP-like cAMP-binding protein
LRFVRLRTEPSANISVGIPTHCLPTSSGAGDGALLGHRLSPTSGSKAVSPPKNLLLRALSRDDYALIAADLEPVTLPLKAPLFNPHEVIDRVYFLEDGVASIVSDQDDGRPVEIGIHGREGMSGTPIVLGADRSPHASMIQVGDAPAQSIASERLLEACALSRSLHQLLLRYVHTLGVQTALTAAANATYDLPERCARWLIMCNDRLESDRIELTHEFLSMMLAVRRSGVTVTLHELQETGAIRASRGVITISDRSRLEEIAGDCYGQAEAEYRRLIAPFGGTQVGSSAG